MTCTAVRGQSGLRVIPKLMRDPFAFRMDAAASGEGLVRIKAGPVSAYLVSDPAYVRQVLIDDVFANLASRMWTFFLPSWLPTP